MEDRRGPGRSGRRARRGRSERLSQLSAELVAARSGAAQQEREVLGADDRRQGRSTGPRQLAGVDRDPDEASPRPWACPRQPPTAGRPERRSTATRRPRTSSRRRVSPVVSVRADAARRSRSPARCRSAPRERRSSTPAARGSPPRRRPAPSRASPGHGRGVRRRRPAPAARRGRGRFRAWGADSSQSIRLVPSRSTRTGAERLDRIAGPAKAPAPDRLEAWYALVANAPRSTSSPSALPSAAMIIPWSSDR